MTRQASLTLVERLKRATQHTLSLILVEDGKRSSRNRLSNKRSNPGVIVVFGKNAGVDELERQMRTAQRRRASLRGTHLNEEGTRLARDERNDRCAHMREHSIVADVDSGFARDDLTHEGTPLRVGSEAASSDVPTTTIGDTPDARPSEGRRESALADRSDPVGQALAHSEDA